MKHDGLIQSDQAEKLYSYPTLSGDSDTFLNGAGDFDHPHVEYWEPDGAQSIHYDKGDNAAWHTAYGTNFTWPSFAVDQYGHVIGLKRIRYRYDAINNATATAKGLMSADDKVKLDAYPNISSDVSLTFAELELANGNTVSLLAAVPASEG